MILKKNILIVVVGANGFIGQSIVKYFNNDGYQTLSFIRKKSLPTYNKPSNIDLDAICFYDDSNLPNTLGIPQIIKQMNLLGKNIIVINAAGFAHNKKCINEHLIKDQNKFTSGLLNDILKIKSHFIHISSIAARDYFKSKNQEYFLYGKIKYDLEQKIKEKFSKRRFQIILRLPAVWGEGSPGSTKHLFTLLKYNIPIAVSGILVKSASINTNSLSKNIRELCRVITQKTNVEQITFELSDGNYTLKNLIISISKVLNKKPIFIYISPKIILLFLSIFKMETLRDQLFNEVLIDNSKVLDFMKSLNK